ncbi:transcription antitermination protein NusB [Mycoplasmopsis hyopharyngis]|uniref:transcription antitermination protein NusB n=1 Tax=Mycoplasmopsis hyopharyngis TaxID=29558 RepID=UPI003873A33B
MENFLNDKTLSKSRKTRIEIINILYQNELFEKTIDLDKLFVEEKELSNLAFKKIEKIANHYHFFVQTIQLFINQNWAWNRLSPVIRAILILAAYELMEIDQPKIVINEAIELTKMYFDDEVHFKMVNAILQNIYKYYLKNELETK